MSTCPGGALAEGGGEAEAHVDVQRALRVQEPRDPEDGRAAGAGMMVRVAGRAPGREGTLADGGLLCATWMDGAGGGVEGIHGPNPRRGNVVVVRV